LKRKRKLFYEFHGLAGVLGQIFKDVHFERKKNPLKMIQLHAQRATLGSEKNETFALQNE